jgi:hypothetical protein
MVLPTQTHNPPPDETTGEVKLPDPSIFPYNVHVCNREICVPVDFIRIRAAEFNESPGDDNAFESFKLDMQYWFLGNMLAAFQEYTPEISGDGANSEFELAATISI